jgi:Xaa-Pro aminopeptidase
MKNNSKMKEGELVLMDIGAEYNMYAADITRTIPVDGKFSEKQETIYRLVLKALQEAIGEMEPGKGVLLANHKAAEIIMKGLQDLGLVTNPDSGWQKEFYLWYFFSHWLGIDVHDVGEYLTEKPEEGTTLDQIKGRSLKPGMVLTIEPSIFLPENGLERARALKEKGVSSEKIEAFLNKVRPVYKKYKGIGVRIVEDVLITEDGPKVLTSQLPRNVEAIENLMDKSSDYVSTDQ